MQLIARYDIADYDRWKAAFNGQSEALGQAGLSVLQIWREDGAARVFVLYQLSDRGRAEKALAAMGDLIAAAGGVSASEYHYVRTA
ncbi:hypothetical protein ACEYYA_02935 [Paracoccus sp. p3-h83]|uniref:hypothetical protein n=1 Tax=Paracoccus sp. p3-h83 TaxID=3342805 RepID=UPI0035B98053